MQINSTYTNSLFSIRKNHFCKNIFYDESFFNTTKNVLIKDKYTNNKKDLTLLNFYIKYCTEVRLFLSEISQNPCRYKSIK